MSAILDVSLISFMPPMSRRHYDAIVVITLLTLPLRSPLLRRFD